DEFGVVRDAGLVVDDPLVLRQRGPVALRQQREVDRVGVDEPAPAFQRGGRLPPVFELADLAQNRHFLASSRASNTGSGITLASAPSATPTSSTGSSSTAAASAGSGLGRGPDGEFVARVRPATRRDRLSVSGCGPCSARSSRSAAAAASSASVASC